MFFSPPEISTMRASFPPRMDASGHTATTRQAAVWNSATFPRFFVDSCTLILISSIYFYQCYTHTHTHTHLSALFPGLPGWAGTRKVRPIWILLKQETVSGSSISWAICKSAPRSRQITTPTPHCSVFYRPDALPAAQPTALKAFASELNNEYFTRQIF